MGSSNRTYGWTNIGMFVRENAWINLTLHHKLADFAKTVDARAVGNFSVVIGAVQQDWGDAHFSGAEDIILVLVADMDSFGGINMG